MLAISTVLVGYHGLKCWRHARISLVDMFADGIHRGASSTEEEEKEEKRLVSRQSQTGRIQAK